jgi:poly(hydroxyalkanoate) depolymerase family esterase
MKERMKDSMLALMNEATALTRSGRLQEATDVIQRALRGTPAAQPGSAAPADDDSLVVLDGCVFEVDEVPPTAAVPAKPATPNAPAATAAPRVFSDATPGPGEFTRGTHTEAGLTRHYKLYAPPGAQGRALPLVVMLHGCTQDPDDFAAGTAMNERAREQGFFVLYPAQAADANPQRCWNWFKHNHQRRGSGEPAVIAGMTREVLERHGIDANRVYIAGLSAGGAMAALVAAAYPDLFAAVGIHSGLPGGSASSVPEALAAMSSGSASVRAGTAPLAVPTIVFHGDEDRTVHPRNGEQLIMGMLNAATTTSLRAVSQPQVQQGVSARGTRYTRSTYAGAEGQALGEHWVVHGAGHAWSGGSVAGSYTDAKGPDATREMLRFFFGHPRAAAR